MIDPRLLEAAEEYGDDPQYEALYKPASDEVAVGLGVRYGQLYRGLFVHHANERWVWLVNDYDAVIYASLRDMIAATPLEQLAHIA